MQATESASCGLIFSRHHIKCIISIVILSGFACAFGVNSATAQTINMDPASWQLVLSHDFRNGDKPSIYNKYCGVFGGNDGSQSVRSTNFSPANVYWSNGALVLKFEKRRNQACTGDWGEHAGGGLSFTMGGYRSIAVEAEIAGNDVLGSQSYMTTWPIPGQTSTCAWGAEDDFFEQVGRLPRRVWSTTHSWNNNCERKLVQTFYDVPTYASFHAYAVKRVLYSSSTDVTRTDHHGCINFFLDGKFTKSSCSNFFRPYLMRVGAGIGFAKNSDIDYARLPAYMKIRKIRIWRGLP